jgi:hypothetical protein
LFYPKKNKRDSARKTMGQNNIAQPNGGRKAAQMPRGCQCKTWHAQRMAATQTERVSFGNQAGPSMKTGSTGGLLHE